MHLFKKYRVTFFDVLIALMVIAIIGALLWLRVSRKSQWISIRMVVSNDEWWWEGSPPQWWYVDSLTAGQVSRNSVGEPVAKILNVQSFDVGSYRRRAFIDIQVKGSFDTKRQVYLYNYQPLQIGKPLDLLFGKYNIRGIVTYIDSIPQGYMKRIIEVRSPSMRPWLANSYTPGLEMKDSAGRTLAKIVSVRSSPSRALEVRETNGNVEEKYDGSSYTDVFMQVEISTFESGGVSYFVDRSAIKIGEKIWFQFPHTVARNAEIIQIIQ